MAGHVLDEPEPGAWFNKWFTPDGSLWLAFARLGDGYMLRFPALVDYFVSGDARVITSYSQPGVPLETMRHLLLNQVIPLALSHQGKLILHASACLTEHGAIAFVGSTGAGKSTIAASFGLRGLPVLTDDCLRVEEQDGQVVCYPSYPGLRLWPESLDGLFDQAPDGEALAHYTDKKRFVVGASSAAGPFPLHSVYILANRDDPTSTFEANGVVAGGNINGENRAGQLLITQLQTTGALLETIKHTFQLDPTDRARISQSFVQYTTLAKHIPFFQLAYPQQFKWLPAVNQAVLAHLNS